MDKQIAETVIASLLAEIHIKLIEAEQVTKAAQACADAGSTSEAYECQSIWTNASMMWVGYKTHSLCWGDWEKISAMSNPSRSRNLSAYSKKKVGAARYVPRNLRRSSIGSAKRNFCPIH